MRTLILLIAAVVYTSSIAFSQTGACDFISVTTEYISNGPSTKYPGKCDVKINLTWEQNINNGNKYAYIHLWQSSSYQPFVFTNPSNPPMAANLSNTLGTIVVKDPSTNPTLYYTYNPDNNYTKVLPLSGYGQMILKKVSVGNVDRFTIENVELAGLTCNSNGIYELVATAWSSQSNHGENVHCNSPGNQFSLNKMVDRSLFSCTGKSIQPQFLSNAPLLSGSYKIFADNANPGIFDPAADAAITPTINFQTSAAALLSGTWQYNFVAPVITIPSAYSQSNFWIEVIAADGESSQVFELMNSCKTLAVTFANFTAVRSKNNVNIKWQTLTESNTKGFNVQRKTNGDWTTVSFVSSKSGGNSNTSLSYEFMDLNSFGGVSQYQLVEVSVDGKLRTSEVKAVKGENVPNKFMLYPNPSSTGLVTLVFESNSSKEIAIYDISGRIIKQVKNITNNNLVVDNLQTGFYTVRIVDEITDDIISGKFIVNKR